MADSVTLRATARAAAGPRAPRRRRARGATAGSPRWIASKQNEIASKGGRAAHAKGTAHEFDSGEAREAGRKGGVAVSRNREHMAAIGRRGGEARGHARGRAAAQANTAGMGSAREGAIQNSRTQAGNASERELRSPIASSDRQVAIANSARAIVAAPVHAVAERRPGTEAAPTETNVDH